MPRDFSTTSPFCQLAYFCAKCTTSDSVKTGDVLQFGVDVDNNPKHTYWCVVSQIICGEANYTFQEADWDRGINQYTKANSQSTAAAATRQRQATQQQPVQNGIENTDPGLKL